MDVEPPSADSEASATSKTHTAAEAEISGSKTEPTSNPPVKAKWGWPAGSKNKPKVAQALEMVNDTSKSTDILPEMCPAAHVVTQPQPIQWTWVVDPAGPDRPQIKCSSAEVKAAAAQKLQLQEEVKELNKWKIQAMAEMEVQEELEEEEEECLRTTHILNIVSMMGLMTSKSF